MNHMQRLVLASALQELDYSVLSSDARICNEELAKSYAKVACRKASSQGKSEIVTKLFQWQLIDIGAFA